MSSKNEVALNDCFEPTRIPFRWAYEWALDGVLRANPNEAKSFLVAFQAEYGHPYGEPTGYEDGFPDFPPGVGFLEGGQSNTILTAIRTKALSELLSALCDGAIKAEGFVSTDLSLELDFDEFLSKNYAPEPFDEFNAGPIFRAPGRIEAVDRAWWHDLGDVEDYASWSYRVKLVSALNGDTSHAHYELATDGLDSSEIETLKAAALTAPVFMPTHRHLLSWRHNLVVRLDLANNDPKITASAFDLSIERAALDRAFGEPHHAKKFFANSGRGLRKVNKSGGRTPDHVWQAMLIEACRLIHIEGFPDVQNDLVKRLSQWFIDNDHSVPSDSQIRTRVTTLYRACGMARG